MRLLHKFNILTCKYINFKMFLNTQKKLHLCENLFSDCIISHLSNKTHIINYKQQYVCIA